jgi:hypothetical protein
MHACKYLKVSINIVNTAYIGGSFNYIRALSLHGEGRRGGGGGEGGEEGEDEEYEERKKLQELGEGTHLSALSLLCVCV